jgi:hypothetical protein
MMYHPVGGTLCDTFRIDMIKVVYHAMFQYRWFSFLLLGELHTG